MIEAELTDEIINEKGERVQIGSVAGGGRYDGLVARFKGTEVPATGVSIGVSRLIAALKALGRAQDESVHGPVVVLVLDQSDVARSQAMVSELRAAGIRSELYLGTAGMKAQLKYADRRAAAIAVIEGEDERAQGQVTLKDLALGAELSQDIADNKTWREDQPAQESIDRGELVAGVGAMIARQQRRGASSDGRGHSQFRMDATGRERLASVEDKLCAQVAAAGYRFVDLPIIQPAAAYLDMAGEDVRRRIYTMETETEGELPYVRI